MPSAAFGLVTVGHGTLHAEALVALLHGAGVVAVVDVRRYPGSRRWPHFDRDAMASWLPGAGIGYRWEPDLGGRRRADRDSPNTALRNAAFRGYADHMRGAAFRAGLGRVVEQALRERTAVLCAESLWWRCHRRLLADAAVLLHGVAVADLLHDGRSEPHRLTEGARRDGDVVTYAGGAAPPRLFPYDEP